MDYSNLKKRLSTFKTSKGILTRISEELLFEVMRAWEGWPGASTDLAKELGITVRQLGFLVQKAKKLIREGLFVQEGFKEIKLETSGVSPSSGLCGIEITWDHGKVIRFSQVDQLVEFLKKVA